MAENQTAEGQKPRSVWPWIFFGCFTVILLGALGIGLTIRKMFPAFKGAMEMGKKTAEEHAALEREFPFTPPGPQAHSTPVPERFRDVLLIRNQKMLMFKPETFGVDPAQMQNRQNAIDVISSMTGRMTAMMGAETAAMRTARMGSTEYEWLMGQLVTQALTNANNQTAGEPGDTAGQEYWRNLKLQESSDQEFHGQDLLKELRESYGQNLAVPDWALKELDSKSSNTQIFMDISRTQMLPGIKTKYKPNFRSRHP